MAATFQWYDDEKTIMYISYVPPWTWQDYLDVAGAARDEVASVDQQVVSIADFTATDMLPLTSGLVKMVLKGIGEHPSNWHGVIVVTNKRMVQTMAKLFQGATRNVDYEVYLEDSVENALKLIEKIRTKS